MAVSLKTLIAASTAAVATFGNATATQRDAFRDAAVSTVKAIKAGEEAETALERSKGAFDYSNRDKKLQDSFRTWAKYVRNIAANATAEQLEGFYNGTVPASTVDAAIRKPERDKKAAEKKADKEATEQAAQKEREKLERAAARVITPAEMLVHGAAWIDSLQPDSKLTKAQTKALEIMLGALRDYRERCTAPASQEVALAA